MTDPIFSDPALRDAKRALDGLSLRQEIIGNNLANVDTPGYRAQRVDFEGALRSARRGRIRLQATQPGHLAAPQAEGTFRLLPRQGGASRADGNNVDVDVELVQMAETGIRFQAVSQLVRKKLLLLRTIATGR